jgi:hypothetical protein
MTARRPDLIPHRPPRHPGNDSRNPGSAVQDPGSEVPSPISAVRFPQSAVRSPLSAFRPRLLPPVVILLAAALAACGSGHPGPGGARLVDANGVRSFGPAWAVRRHGIHLLHLEGTDYEMGYQHGMLLREEARGGQVPYLRRFFRAQIAHSFIGRSPTLVDLAEGFMLRTFYDPVARNLPVETQDAFDGLADATGLDRDLIARSAVMADAAQTIAGTLYGQRTIYPGLDRFRDFGCTSFIAAGPATRDGHVLHGRNFDFPGAGHFDRDPVIAWCQPRSGPRYVMFTTAGLHTAGVTAINEYGLAVGFHTSITSDVKPDGWPVMGLSDEIIRHARTLEDALAVLRRHPPAAGWILVISSARERRGLAVEISRNRLAVVPMDGGILAVANSYRTPELMPQQTSMNWAESINSYCRTKRMNQLLKANRGRIDPQRGAAFLGDHFDILSGGERATGDVIAQMSNVSSVVIDSSAGNFWVAVGPAPVCNSAYAGFRFEDGFGRPEDVRELPGLRGTWENDPRLAAYRRYIAAEAAYERGPGLTPAMAELKRAIALDPGEPVYAQVLGLVCLRAGRPAEAEALFTRALARPQSFHRRSLGHLWRARSLDLQGRRAEALADYRRALAVTPLNPQLREAAEDGLREPYSAAAARTVMLDFGSGDSYGY